MVWSGFPFIRSGQNHLARHIERRKKTRQTEKEMRSEYQRTGRSGVRQVPEGRGEQRKMEKTGCKIMWCPNDPRGYGIDDDDDDDELLCWNISAVN